MKLAKKTNIMHDLFIKNVKIVTAAFTEMQAAVHAFCQQDAESLNLHTAKVIELENQSDLVREQIIDLLFTKETMVFSRADRLDIVESLDRIGDETEVVVQKLLLYHPVPEAELAIMLDDYSEKVGALGKDLEELIESVLYDFSKSFTIADKIQEKRGEIRKKHWILLKWNYGHHSHPQEFFYYQYLIKDLCRIADVTEEFSDYIRGLVCKYS